MKRKRFLQSVLGAAATFPLFRSTASAQTNSSNQKVGEEIQSRAPLPALPEGAWSLVALPDTQAMSLRFPKVFRHQTEWIAAQRETYQIQFVVHEGDIVDRNTHPEWLNARHAIDALVDARIPFSLLPGNHDLGRWGRTDDRSSLMSEYFHFGDYRNSAKVGYFERGQIENTWHEVNVPTGKLLVLSLEFGPRDHVLDWANTVVAERRDFDVIVVTHAYLYHDGTRYDWAKKGKEQTWNPKDYPLGKQPGGVNDAEEMWTKFVSRHGNIRFVLSGHVLKNGTGYLISEGAHGNRVHQILANYQAGVVPDRGFGGAGFLRLMHFLPDHQTVQVKTYSPWYDQWLVEPEHQFTVTL